MEHACGLGPCFRPPWLQRFATSFSFFLVYAVLGTTQAMTYIYFVATLTTVEKRFKIPSKTAGLLMSGNEVSQIILSLVLSYYGGQKNRPFWIGIGVAFCSLSCFILALPHLVYGAGQDALQLTYEYGASLNATTSVKSSGQELCILDDRDDCMSNDTFAKMPLALIFISQFVLGIGTTLYYSLGQTYLDDNTKKSKTPLILGCVLALRTVGPALGFALGFGCLSLYIEPSLTPLIDNKDPRWLGAWWLGWVILGCLKLIVAIVISMFPKELPKQQPKTVAVKEESEEQPLKKSNSAQNSLSDSKKDLQEVANNGTTVPLQNGFVPALKRLLTNKLLMCNNLSTVFYILGASGYITYVMKYMETQFQQAAASATGFAGCIAISAMVIGFLTSGIVISHFKPRALYVLSWNVLAGCCYLICEIIFIFLSCPNVLLEQYFYQTNGKFDLTLECNQYCKCSNKYSPVCDTLSNTTYFSPCYAGCSNVITQNNSIQGFTECTCIDGLPSATDLEEFSSPSIIPGLCTSDCWTAFVTFLSIQFFMHLFGNTGKIGNILITYRCVNVEDKSIAQGLTLLMISLFAFIPGPILYGAIIDSTCLVWEQTCNEKGNCWLYNTDDFRLYINITAACLTFVGVALDVVVCYLGKSISLYEDEDEKVPEDKIRNDVQK